MQRTATKRMETNLQNIYVDCIHLDHKGNECIGYLGLAGEHCTGLVWCRSLRGINVSVIVGNITS